MDEDQTEKLIELIRSRPALYDKRLGEYADRNINKTLWREVCEAMLDSWNAMTSQDKLLKVKEIQQRWQNLRTCFKRELNRSKSGQWSKKRRKYIYYNQLLFLLPGIEDTETVTTKSAQRVLGNKEKPKDAPTLSTQQKQTLPEKPKTNSTLSYERSVRNMFKRKNIKEDIDEDKCFLLSLVPSFRRMTDDQKIDAKMEFLSIIKRINQTNTVDVTQDIQNIPSQYFRPTLREIVSSEPAHSDSSRSSFMSSNNPTSSDFIEISQFKVE